MKTFAADEREPTRISDMEHDCKLKITSTRQENPELEITYPNGDSEGLLVTRVEGDLFRLEESSLLEDAFYGDIVEILLTGDNAGTFQKVVSRSGLKVLQRVLCKEMQNSPKLQPLLDRIMQLGGT